MKKFYIIDKPLRLRFKNLEYKYVFKKIIDRLLFINWKLKFSLLFKKLVILKKSRVRKTCLFTGRSSGNYSYFNASRFVLKGMDRVGILPGLQKLS